MNIFYLDESPYISANMMCDKHVVKMIVETAQLLSTAHHELDGEPSIECYKATHKNHPSAKWVRENRGNYDWAWLHLNALCKEYTFRYGKIHKVERAGLLDRLVNSPYELRHGERTDPPQCMLDDCKQDSTVQAYRDYYIKHKAHFAKWNKARSAPDWFAPLAQLD